ncbi:MAG: BatD family protein [Verrucomicrobiales bacterium]|nr:BatD family protein [Verrucomicrobiales bacterium]
MALPKPPLLFLLTVLAILPITRPEARAQQPFQPTVSVTALSNRVAIGEIGVVMFKINGGDAQMPSKIAVEGLEVAFTGKESRVNMSQGVNTIQTIYSYRFRGNEPGTFTIPEIDILVGRTTVRSKALEVIIYERDESEAMDATRPIFGKLEMPKAEFYVNELLPFTVTGYVRGRNSLRDISHVKFEHENFVMKSFRNVRTEGGEIGNTYYSSAILPSTLFALQPGSFRLGPADIGIRVLDSGSGFGFSSFFSRTMIKDVATNTVNVTVKPLPNGAPLSYTGGVGKFKLAAVPSITKISVGDPISMKFVVTGTGNMQTMEAPRFSVAQTDIWKTYDASKKLEDEMDSDGYSEGAVEFSQVIIPEAKVDTIPPFELSYFDPSEEKYVTLKTDPIPIEVSADTAGTQSVMMERPESGSSPQNFPSSASKPTASYNDMLHIRTANPRWIATLDTKKKGVLFYLVQSVFSIAFFTLLGFGAVRWWKERELRATADGPRFRDLIKTIPGPGTTRREFYQSVSDALAAWKDEHPEAPDNILQVIDRVGEKCDAILYSGAGQPNAPLSRDEASEFRSILQKLPQK